MDWEQVAQTLQEIATEFGIEDLDQFIQSAWQDADPVSAGCVAEVIERASERLLDQYFLWSHIVETEDCEWFIPDGWYCFIAVHPESRLCLTFRHDWVGCLKSICFRARIRNIEDAIDAVVRLVDLIQSNLTNQKEGGAYAK